MCRIGEQGKVRGCVDLGFRVYLIWGVGLGLGNSPTPQQSLDQGLSTLNPKRPETLNRMGQYPRF